MAYTNDSIWKSVDWMNDLHLSDAGYLWMVQRMCGASYDYGEIDFF